MAGDVMDADVSMTVPGTGGIAEAMERGAIDVQVRTARAFPRDITTFLKKLETLATRTSDIAESCFYTLKRKDRNEPSGYKKIQGPSIRFAELLVASWGHMRIAGVTIDQDARFVLLRGMAWDLETNSAFSIDVKRRITTREGHTYSDDMIGVTSNAGISIATRNAILHVIPRALWSGIYDKCLVIARGDAKTLADRWARVLEFFKVQYGKTPADLYAYCGIRGEADVTLDHLEDLQGLRTALKDGETTIDEAFGDLKAGAALAPEVLIASELDCPAPAAVAILAGFTAMNTPPAQRLVMLKRHKGQADVLLQTLRDLSGQALPLGDVGPAEAGHPSPEPQVSNHESTAGAPAEAGPASSTGGQGRFSI